MVLVIDFYLMYDIQLISGGRAHELSKDEYIIAAILVYTDIVNMFIYLLALFGSNN